MKILVLGTHRFRNQPSMSLFAQWIAMSLRDHAQVDVTSTSAVFLNRTTSGWAGAKWLSYLDQFVILPIVLAFTSRSHDLVIVADHSNAFSTVLLPRRKVMAMVHDMIGVRLALDGIPGAPVAGASGRMMQRLVLVGLGRARRLAVTADRVARELLAFGVRTPTTTVGCPLDLERLGDSREPALLAARIAGRRFVLNVATEDWRKRKPFLVETWSALANAHPDTPVLVLAGFTTSETTALAARSGGAVIVASEISNAELVWLYRNCVATIVGSSEEGFCIPILESLYFGKPVLGVRDGAYVEIFGDAILTFEVDRPDRVAESVHAILSDERQLQRGLSNRDELVRRYSFSEFSERVAAAFGIGDAPLGAPDGDPGANRAAPAAGRVRRRRVCVVSPYTPFSHGFGGIARATGDYLTALMLAGLPCTLIASTASTHGTISAEDVERQLPGVRALLYEASISQRWGLGPGLFRRLPDVLRSDVVILQGARSFPTMIAGVMCRLLRRPYYIVAHASLDRSRVARTRTKRPWLFAASEAIVSFAVRGARAIVVTGALEQRTLLPVAAKQPTKWIENFFDFTVADVRTRTLDAPRTYLFVGRLEPDKGILGFSRVWRSAAKADSRLVLVGSGSGPYRDELLAEVAGDTRISYLGEVSKERVAELMQDCAISVLPTGMDAPVTENFGNVIVEAFIAGRPAMVAEGLHWDEYRDHAAVLSFAATAEGAAAAIRRFDAIGPAEYAAMSASAVELATRFHVSRAVPQVAQLVDLVIAV